MCLGFSSSFWNVSAIPMDVNIATMSPMGLPMPREDIQGQQVLDRLELEPSTRLSPARMQNEPMGVDGGVDGSVDGGVDGGGG